MSSKSNKKQIKSNTRKRFQMLAGNIYKLNEDELEFKKKVK